MEDEDVVYEGSAIHEHLKAAGCTDYLVEAHGTNKNDDHLGHVHQEKVSTRTAWLNDFVKTCRVGIGYVWKLLIGEVQLQEDMCMDVITTVFKSDLLNRDDLLMLEHFSAAAQSCLNGSYISDRAAVCNTKSSVMKSSGFISVYFLGLSAVLGPSHYCGVIWEVLGICVLLLGLFMLLRRKTRLKYWTAKCHLNEVVATVKEASHLSSKSLKLLQEMDLTSRGFVLAVGDSSFYRSAPETFPTYETIKTCLSSLLVAACCFLAAADDYLDYYATDIEYPKLHSHLMRNEVLRDDLEPSLQVLKARRGFLKIQVSSVLTKFLICQESPNFSKGFAGHLHKVFQPAKLMFFKKSLEKLKSSVTFVQNLWLQESEPEQLPCYEKKKDNLYVAIHSLSLHLQAAIFKTVQLERDFEFETASQNSVVASEDYPLPPYEDIRQQLDLIKMELDLSVGCWEEAVGRSCRKLNKEKTTSPARDHSVDGGSNENGKQDRLLTDISPVPVIDECNPVIQDEVFEAYIDESAFFEKDDPAGAMWLADHGRECESQKQQRDQSKRVLHELQPILRKRREMWEAREACAIQRMRENATEGSTCSNQMKVGNTSSDTNQLEHDNQELDLNGSSGVCKHSGMADASDNITPLSSESVAFVDDSDDARLNLYKKVREELDNDEKSRNAFKQINRAGENKTELIVDQDIRKLSSALCANMLKPTYLPVDKAALKKCNTEGKGNSFHATESINLVPSVGNRVYESTSWFVNSSFHCDTGDTVGNSTEVGTSLPVKEVVYNTAHTRDTVGNNTEIGTSVPVKEVVYSTVHNFVEDSKSNENEAIATKSCDNKEELYSSGGNVDDDYAFKTIDWSTMHISAQQLGSLQDRVQLSCDNPCFGFQSHIATAAVEASRSFSRCGLSCEETFRGVGEGEEKFVNSDSDESTSNVKSNS